MQVQDEMVKLKLTQEDELLLAVAGLKQVTFGIRAYQFNLLAPIAAFIVDCAL